jgi:Uma2 family endonuclease
MPGEIVLPETKPETEWVRGRPLQKVSPTRSHSRLQLAFGAALNTWALGRGEVASEWRFRIAPAGERRRPLVPDISYVALDRLRGHTTEELETPAFAPTVAIEILSPRDEPADVASKIDVSLRGGAELVIVVDPASRTLLLHDGASRPVELRSGDTLRHAALPGFELDVAALFSRALDLPF